MRLLANENFPGEAVDALRHVGHDVYWVRESNPGMLDPDVLAFAQAEVRILLTFDKDFGELAYRSGLPADCGVILFRIPMRSSSYITQAALAAMQTRADWAGHFSVIEEERIRMAPLPKRI